MFIRMIIQLNLCLRGRENPIYGGRVTVVGLGEYRPQNKQCNKFQSRLRPNCNGRLSSHNSSNVKVVCICPLTPCVMPD